LRKKSNCMVIFQVFQSRYTKGVYVLLVSIFALYSALDVVDELIYQGCCIL